MTEIKLYKSPWKAIKLIALAVPLVVGSIWMIVRTDSSSMDRVMGWIGAIFFGSGIPIFLYHLLDGSSQIIINEIGIFDKTIHKDFINWEIIEGAFLRNIHGQKFICLKVSDEFEPSKKKGFLYKKMAKINEAMGFQELNINLGQR